MLRNIPLLRHLNHTHGAAQSLRLKCHDTVCFPRLYHSSKTVFCVFSRDEAPSEWTFINTFKRLDTLHITGMEKYLERMGRTHSLSLVSPALLEILKNAFILTSHVKDTHISKKLIWLIKNSISSPQRWTSIHISSTFPPFLFSFVELFSVATAEGH